METLVTIEELRARVPFVMDEDEEREASGALDDLSDDARMYGKSSWLTATGTPRQVKNLILRAAVRHMKNHEGFTQSRAGDETLAWTDRGEDAGSAYFTDREIKALRTLAGGSTLHSANTTAYGPMRTREAHTVPVAPQPFTEKPFPYFADGTEPW